MWDFSVYSHLLIPVVDKVVAYPLVGVSMLGGKSFPHPKIMGELGSFSKKAFTAGIGADYKLLSSLILRGEIRLKIYDGFYDNKYFNFAIGLAYKF